MLFNLENNSKKIVLPTDLRTIKQLIWLYFCLLIFEGVLRKWVVPQLSSPLLIIRDPLVILTYFFAFKQGIFAKDVLTKLIICVALISLLGGLATVIIDNTNLLVTFFGIRTNFLHLPLIFLMYKVFNIEDVKKLGKWVLLLAIPIALLMVYQFNSPPDAFINRTAGAGGEQIGSALGKIRTPGPFSYVTAAGQYFALVASFFLYGLFERKVYPNWLLCATGVSIVLAGIVSGSRYAILSIAVVFMSLLILFLIRPAMVGNSAKFIVVLGVVGFGISFIPTFNQGIEVMSSRQENASASEAGSGGIFGRFFTNFFRGFDQIDDIPLLGYGPGMGTNVGAALLTGKTQFLLAEEEWQRVILESGPIIGVLFILLRTFIVGWMGGLCIKNASAGNILPFLLFSAGGLLLLNGQFSRSSDIGFAVLIAGLCLASTKYLVNKYKQPNENFTRRQLLT